MPERAGEIVDDMKLVEPDWSEGDVREVLEQFADLAIVVVHHLLDRAPAGSMARLSADMLLDFIRTEVAGVLGDQMPPMCTVCGTSGSPEFMATSSRHQAHLTTEAR